MKEPSTRPLAARPFDWRLHGAVLAVLLATFVVYAPVLHHGFVEWDDPAYVLENVHVRSGLSAHGIVWAFTTFALGNWNPLTWCSHMLDVSLFGLAPWGHHLTSLLLHLANTWVLFAALRRLTGSAWRSLAVAALFALHPLHVESVAWVSERKDVLSTLFWMATLWAYARFAERPTFARNALVVLSFGLGLMAKPMLVSLPLVLLILDGWPLRRAGSGDLSAWRSRVFEKLPLVAMSVAASVAAMVAQRSVGAVSDTPLATRLANSVLGYAGYLEKTLWPTGLAAFYPYPLHPPMAEAAAKGVLLALLTGAAVWFGRRRPYLLAGWLWYGVTLAPVIGIVRIGQQAMADRYTYIPLVGVFVIFVWGVADLVAGMRGASARRVAAVSAMLVAAALAFGARQQLGTWKTGVTLWERVLAEGGTSTVSHNNLGAALEKAGRLDEAASHYAEAIRLEPRHARAHANLGNVRFAQGRFADAIPLYEAALRLDPSHEQARQNLALAYYNVANSRWRAGRLDEALRDYREAVRWRPDDAAIRRALGLALVQAGRSDEAIDIFRSSLQLEPESAATHDALAMALFSRGDYPGAWREVQACRQRGGLPNRSLVEALGRRMPEPR